MEGQRRLMGEDAELLGPEPGRDEVLMLARWEVNETVDASAHPERTTALDVMQEELRGVTCLRRLLGGEAAVLRGGDLVELVPVWTVGEGSGHARNVKMALGLCSRDRVVTSAAATPTAADRAGVEPSHRRQDTHGRALAVGGVVGSSFHQRETDGAVLGDADRHGDLHGSA